MNVARSLAFGAAKVMALLGGLLLLVLIVVTCLSVVGRMLNTIGNSSFIKINFESVSIFLQKFAPINGDFELVEMGIALAIFLFLPWCQLNRRHAAVHIFTVRLMSKRGNAVLLLIWEALFVAILGLITVQLYAGMGDRITYNETTFLLQWPVWWPYAACAIAGALATLIGLYSIKMHFDDFASDESMRV